MYVTKFKNQIRLKHGRNHSVRQAASVKGKLRSKNILPYMKAHIPSISKIVVIWCSTDLNFSSGSLKSLKIAVLEHQKAAIWNLGNGIEAMT